MDPPCQQKSLPPCQQKSLTDKGSLAEAKRKATVACHLVTGSNADEPKRCQLPYAGHGLKSTGPRSESRLTPFFL